MNNETNNRAAFRVEQVSIDGSPMRTHWVDTWSKAERIAKSWELQALDSECYLEQCSMVVIEREPYTDAEIVDHLLSGGVGAFVA